MYKNKPSLTQNLISVKVRYASTVSQHRKDQVEIKSIKGTRRLEPRHYYISSWNFKSLHYSYVKIYSAFVTDDVLDIA